MNHSSTSRRPLGEAALRNIKAFTLAATLTLAAGCGGGEPGAAMPSNVTQGAAAASPGAVTAVTVAAEPEARPKRDLIDLSAHVPADALAYVEVRSLAELEEAGLRLGILANGVAAEMFPEFDVTLPLVTAGIDTSKLDHDAPFAIAAVPIPDAFFPAYFLIIPQQGADSPVPSTAALAGQGLKAREVDGGYVIVEDLRLGSWTERGGAEVTHDIGDGLICGRANGAFAAPLLAPFVRQIADALNEQYRVSRPSVSAKQLRTVDADAIIQGLAGIDDGAFAFDIELDQIDFSFRSYGTAGAGGVGAVDSTLADLAHHVDRDAPLSVLMAFDPDSVVQDLQTGWDEAQASDLMDGPGAEAGEILTDLFGSEDSPIAKALGAFKPGAVMTNNFEPGKAHVAFYLTAHEAGRAREAISYLVSSCELDSLGFELALPVRSMQGSTLVEDYSIRFDTRRLDFDARAAMREAFKNFLGDSTLHLKVATAANHVLVILGGDTAAVSGRVRDFSAKGTCDKDLGFALEKVSGAGTAMVCHADLVTLFSHVSGLVAVADGHSVADTHREIARATGNGGAPFTVWSATEGSDEISGVTFEMSALSRAFEAFKGSGL